jgi:hypothetical protein
MLVAKAFYGVPPPAQPVVSKVKNTGISHIMADACVYNLLHQ